MPEDEKSVADEYRLSADAVKYYANNVRFQTTAWDLKLLFGEVELAPDGGSLVEQKVSVRLPWVQAKVMAIFLAINIADYEENNGALTVPKFVFPEPLKHLGGENMSLEDMFSEIVRVYHEQRDKSPKD